MVQETARINFEATNLDAVEGRIKAIGGAINVLGGSIEVVVGSMGLIGIDPKVTEQFQKAATSAIAFADGAKRVFEGYKELREAADLFRKAQVATTAATATNTTATIANSTAQNASVGVLGKVRNAFNALTAAMLRNPITAIVVGLTALVAAIIAFGGETEEATDDTAKLNKELRDLEINTQKESLILQNLGKIVQDTNVDIGARKRLYQDLQKQIPILSGLTLEEAIATGKLNLAIKDQITLLKLQSKAKATQLLMDRSQKALLDSLDLTRLDAAQKLAILQGNLTASQIQTLAPKMQGQGGLIAQLSSEIKGFNNELTNLTIEIAKAQTQVEVKPKPEAKPDAKKEIDEVKKAQELSEQIGKLRREEDLKRESELLQELEKIDDSYEQKFLLAKGNEELTNQLIESLRNERIAKIKEYDEKELQAQREADEKRKNDKEKFYDNQLEAIDNFYKKEELQIKKSGLTKEELDQQLYENELKRLKTRLALAILYRKQTTDIELEIQNLIKNGAVTTTEELSNLQKLFISDTAKTIAASLSALNSVMSGFLAMAQENSQARLNSIEAEYNSRMQGLVGTDEEIAAQQEAIEAEKNRVMEAERRKAFEDQKNLKIADTITSGTSAAYQAFASAIGQLGPIAGPIVGGVLSAMILAQMANTVANLKKQQYIGDSTASGGGGGSVSGYNFSNFGGGYSGAPAAGSGGGGAMGGSSGGNMSAPNPQNNALQIRAYIVASDVETGLEAQADLNARRRL